MTIFGVDYAWERPDPKALQDAGVVFACRYLSHDTTGKNLTAREAIALADHGIWSVVVWESAADRALDGRAAGIADAMDAQLQAQACGMPGDRPIYFAVDFDAGSPDEAAIEAYLGGAASVLGAGRVGVYGEYSVVQHALDTGHATWGLQTYAWSGGQWDPRAQLQQYLNDQPLAGVSLDYDRATKSDFGQWKPGKSPAPNQEDDMPQGQLNRDGTKNTPISIPPGKYRGLGFAADNGFLGHAPVKLRVAQRIGKGNWHLDHVVVDSAADKTAMPLLAAADQVSITYEDDALVPVGWDMS